MTITNRGLVCIPIEIRQALGISPGQTVLVEEKNGTVIIRKNKRATGFYEDIANSGFGEIPIRPRRQDKPRRFKIEA